MDKTQEPRKQAAAAETKPLIWDCESSLYDSFELKSFERHLSSAISSRSLSMPHLSDRRINIHHHPQQQQPTTSFQPKRSSSPSSSSSSSSSKISRSLQKLLKSVFRPGKQTSTKKQQIFRVPEPSRDGGGSFYVVYDKSAGAGELSTIPEATTISPEIRSLVRRTASERFTPAASVGISCA